MDALETAGFATWPCLEEEHVRGWRLRYGGGYTKRANSANATAHAAELSDADIDDIERRFSARGLEPVFRLATPLTPPGVDTRLAQRGYRAIEPSVVMRAALADPRAEAGARGPVLRPHDPPAPVISLHPLASWLAAYEQVSGKGPRAHDAHLRLLQAIDRPCAFALLHEGDAPVCCGLAVREGTRLGLFEIATRAGYGGRGLARSLCAGLMDWGRAQGARESFLQVGADNDVALRLYRRLGFQRAYDYGYRVPA
jgi:GNAT superfamily N-acetyltransferase